MKITDIKIDGFGVWHNLPLRGISPEITVFYGPNEAGKSTLMQFLRTVLYGVSKERRERYMPPIAGGRPGGWLKVIGDDGPLTVSRYADRGPTDVGKVTVTTAEGEEQGDRLLREALEHVDETTYNNIFAVGLREVQELATLSDTAAAQWLYRLTSGLDRISLYDVIHMLKTTRGRLLSSPHEPSELRTLLHRRDQLRGELDELIAKGRRWAQSAVKLRELADDIERRQHESKALESQARRLELAIGLKPLWVKRERIDEQLASFNHLRPLEDGTLTTLDDFNKKIDEHGRQRDILRGQRLQLREEGKRLGINDILVRNGQRLEALLEQQEWLQAIERLAGELKEEITQLEGQLGSENERLSHEWTGAGKIPPRITEEVVEQLSPQSRAIEATEQLVAAAKHELDHHRTGEHQFRSQIESAITDGEKMGLPTDREAAGDLVAQLRRRQQVEKRLAESQREFDELQAQAQDMVADQVVPLTVFAWLLAAFIFGAVGVGMWWLVPASKLGSLGGWFGVGGIATSVGAWLFKFFVENSASERFDTCHRQLDTLQRDMLAAQAEEERLDHELPMAPGSAAIRLQHAERHLAELERILPVESQRREAAQEISAAERRLKQAEEKFAAAKSNWQAKLRALGLPGDLAPASLAAMAIQCEKLAEFEVRLQNRRDDLARREREFSIVSQRIFALADETALRKEKLSSLAQLDHLAAEYRQQTQRVERRKDLRERIKALKVEQLKHARSAVGYQRRREALFQKCGVEDENALRQLAAKLDEADQLRKKHATVTREITVAIGKHGSEQDFAPFLAADRIGRLEPEWEALTARLEEFDRQLKESLQQRGVLVEQQRTMAADRSLANKQMDLDVVEEQIKRGFESWRERATLGMLLEHIRQDYEAHRQPETLKEASGYMSQLTSGRYKRIWTPLSHDVLLVDTQDGQSLPVNVLSRGTREQLFVSLRLALVAAYARRGIHLPMILDDVFVNFDAGRTKMATTILRDFAKQGHQLLFFTCHEHVWRMFQEIRVDARRLPNRYGNMEEEEAAEQEVPEVIAEAPPEPELVQVVEPEPVPEVIEPVVVVEAPKRKRPVPVVEVIEPIIEERLPEPLPPSPLEVEYTWDSQPRSSWDAIEERQEAATNGWLPEVLIHPQRW